MSFVALVTRKEKNTGTTISAKIVDPDKNVSTKKHFKVKVKANSLDDYSCCVMDHATIKSRLERSDLMNISNDLALIFHGEHGTDISYLFVDDSDATNTGKITEYIDSTTGAVKGRPKFGASNGDVKGYLGISVRKGSAMVQSKIPVAIKAVSAEEIYSDLQFTSESLWKRIHGQNPDTYDENFDKGSINALGGNYQIQYNLDKVTQIYIDDKSLKPVNLRYEVVDEISNYLIRGHEDPQYSIQFENEVCEPITARMSNDLVVNPISYTASALCLRNSAIPVTLAKTMYPETNIVNYNKYTVTSGLTIKVYLSIDGAEEKAEPVILRCGICSRLLTGEEIFSNIVRPNLKFKVNNGTEKVFGADQINPTDVIVPATTNAKIELPTSNYLNDVQDPIFSDLSFAGKIGDHVRLSYTLYKKDSDTDKYVTSSFNPFVDYNGQFLSGGGQAKYQILEFDSELIADIGDSMKGFSVNCLITIDGFAQNGFAVDGSSATTSTATLVNSFLIDNSAIAQA